MCNEYIDLQTHECLKHNYERFYNRIKSLPRLDPFSGFWRDWLLGPGRDFRVRYNQFSGSHKVVNVNEVTTTMMTRIWIQATFLAMAKRHFSNETHYVEMPRFGLLRNSDQELILRVVSPSISLKKILQNRVCTDRGAQGIWIQLQKQLIGCRICML